MVVIWIKPYVIWNVLIGRNYLKDTERKIIISNYVFGLCQENNIMATMSGVYSALYYFMEKVTYDYKFIAFSEFSRFVTNYISLQFEP